MDEWKNTISSDNIFIKGESEGMGGPFTETEEDIIAELKLRILENRYELKIENIIDRLLWYGVHVFRMSNQSEQNIHLNFGGQEKYNMER